MGGRSRSFTYDWLGRMTSETNPESGTKNYIYDTDSTMCGNGAFTSNGDLVKTTDAAGNCVLYYNDALHRVTDVGNGNQSASHCKRFRYDNSAGYAGSTKPLGLVNTLGRLIEAATDYCYQSNDTLLTDEWFSYSPRGELTDVYELTPNSTEYYHTTASFWPTGTLETLSGIPGVPTLNYGAGGGGLDGEGRYTQITASSGTNPVTSVSYSTSSTTNPLGALTGVTYGSTDSDSFTYDSNTGRPLTYTFAVNGKNDTGTLTWNTNATLSKLVIADSISSTSDSQTCNYIYDDLGRIGGKNSNGYSVDCGSSKWQQLFTYDAFGNISKSGTSSFLPTYSTSPPTNLFTSIPGVTAPYYDANGNLTKDNLNTYTWDAYGNMLTVNSVSATYDAFGRVVEQYNGSAYTQILYSPVGKTALMSGSTLTKAFVNLPGGGTAIYNSTGLAYYRHSDWLGSSRLTSTQARGLYSAQACAPFGEQYTTYPTAGSADPSYTGQNSDTTQSLYDFTFRRQSMSQGRWISPDPLGVAAADPTSPQTWNRYAYVANNPLSYVDPLGLQVGYTNPCDQTGQDGNSCGGGGGGPTDSDEQTFDNQYSSSYWMQQALNSYVSWINAMWLAGGSVVTSSVNGLGYSIDWSIGGGAVYVAPNGETLNASDVQELGLTALSAADTPDYSLSGPGGPGGGTGGHTCPQNRILNAIPGATPTSYDVNQGGHEQIGIDTTAADLADAGFSAFSLFGANGYRNSAVLRSVHCNGQYGAQLGSGGPFTNIQCHIDAFNPATGLFGILGHAIWELGAGSLFFKNSSRLDPRC
ncbi:MAG: RHS repeat-associated core domain-containing protein [Candidatus Sulfotelmatobacter sp.]